MDGLAGGGDFGAKWLVEVGLEDPSAGVGVGGGWGGDGLLPEVALGRGRAGNDGRRRRLRGQGDGRGDGGGPGGAFFDALGVVGKAGIDELLEAVGFARGGVDGDVAANDGNARVPLAADEAAFDGWRGYGAIDRGTVGGGVGLDRDVDAVGEGDAGEADNGDVERGKVPAKAGAGASLCVGAQINDGAVEHGVFRKHDFVVAEDGVKQMGGDGKASAHGQVVGNPKDEGGAGREIGGGCLGVRRSEQKGRAGEEGGDASGYWPGNDTRGRVRHQAPFRMGIGRSQSVNGSRQLRDLVLTGSWLLRDARNDDDGASQTARRQSRSL